ncbi:MAG: hypothetical protein KIT43_13235 [Bauldia sp.]|nr:hypothetical protein [Bauldia sp.]MCW5717017.1 hypothetical protein [Bauldia sp.]
MTKKFLMASAAGAALCASMGSVQAADVMPIVVPVVTPVVVPVPGPVRVVQFETTLATIFPGSGMFFLDSAGAVDVRTASGWGFQLSSGNSHVFGNGGYLTVNGRVYRAMGDATIGVFVNTAFDYGMGGISLQGYGFGVDADYHTEGVDLFYALGAFFNGGFFAGVQSVFLADVERGNFRIEAASLVQGPPLNGFGGVQVGYALGPVTPYAFLAGAFGGGFGGVAGVGLEFEHEVGDRLTLTADALLGVGYGMAPPGLAWLAQAGFEYTLGAGGDGPFTIEGRITTGTGGGFAAEIGIGLKFGDGRVTGTGGILFADLPEWFL